MRPLAGIEAMVRLKWQIEGVDVSGQPQRPWADVMTLKVAQRRRVAAVDPALVDSRPHRPRQVEGDDE